MNLWKIAWRSIEQRALSSTLTAVSMALGVALVIAVLVIYGIVRQSFTESAQGYELIVGAKGGKLQLVLNTVYHLSQPIENLPYSYYKEFTEGKYARYVSVAIPYCLGDNYHGYRVVGTIPKMFESFEYQQGKRYTFSAGENFKQENFFDAVIGAMVANRTGLKVGDKFKPTHGVSEGTGHEHDAFTVVGILAPTGTPNDRALFVNMEGFYLLEGHAKPIDLAQAAAVGDEDAEHEHDAADHDEHAHEEHEHGEHDHHAEPLPDEQKEVTAILIRAATAFAPMYLMRAVNKEPFAQAVFPAPEIANLFENIVGNVSMLLLVLTVLIVIVSGIGIMVSIYNSMNDRRREIAIMRALGAGRTTVMFVVLAESVLLSLCGGVAGMLLGHGLIAALGPYVLAQTGVSIGFLQFEVNELVLIPGLVVLATVVGFLPSLAAYRTDVAKVLSATP